MGQPVPQHDVTLQTSRLPGVPILDGQWDKIMTAPRKESSSKPQTVGQQVSQEAALASWRKLAAWAVRLVHFFKFFPSGFLPECGWALVWLA